MLHQVAQRATDLARAVTWYREFLQVEPIGIFDPPGLAFFPMGETRLLLDVGAPSALLYLRVDDLAGRIDQLRARGVTIESDPHVIFRDAAGQFGPAGEDEWMAFVRDSEDNVLGLVERKPIPA